MDKIKAGMENDITRRQALQRMGGLALGGSGLLTSLSATRGVANKKGRTSDRPNILVILSDQQHWQAIGFQNNFFDTPNIDRLARRSVIFENAFCTTPQCSPSRSSIMTGFYPHKTGVMANVGRSGYHPLQIPTIGTSLRNSGYQTGYFGKWHLGNNPIPRSGWEKLEITRDGNKITATAKEFLLQQKERNSPFALFLSYLNPHHIYQLIPDMFYLRNSDIKEKIRSLKLPKSWQKETFENKPEVQEEFMSHNQGTRLYGNPIEEWKMYRSFYKKKVRLYDNQVGEILATLRQAGLFENTVIVITSDHGDMDTNHRLIFKGPFMYEHMVRVPLIIRVPRKYDGIGARKVANYSAVLTDIVPTLRDFAKLKNKGSDGHSLKPLLTGSGNMEKRDYIISQYYGKQEWVTPIRMIRTKDWKYNTYIGYEDELYDLRNDPHELNNLIGNSGYKKIRKELSDELNRWMNENEDPFYSYCPTKMNGVAFQ